MLKIVITGPESSGKTTLVEELAEKFGVPFVQEMARPFLNGLGRPYEQGDLLDLARIQFMEEQRIRNKYQPKILLCDTDALTIRIWSLEKFGICDDGIAKLFHDEPGDLYLLCTPDIPWEPDPLRENPFDRERLFDVYAHHLKESGLDHIILKGKHSERMQSAIRAIDSLTNDSNT